MSSGHPAVVHPLRIGSPGAPTRGQARSRGWRTTSRGLVVPRHVAATVDQRIAEVAASLVRGGMVTGWASLRLQGCGWFDGLGPDGRTVLPVPVRLPATCRQQPPGAVVRRARFACGVRIVSGIVCAAPETSVLDQMDLCSTGREAVVVMDMAAAGRVTSVRRVALAWERDPRRRGRRRTGWALSMASEHSESPREPRMRMVWELDAGFPRPLVNAVVEALDGSFVCRADLLDAEAGVTGEYDGSVHRDRERHRTDEARLERVRKVGLERFAVVAGDSVATQVSRMTSARGRALWLPVGKRLWRVRPRVGPTLDEELDRREGRW